MDGSLYAPAPTEPQRTFFSVNRTGAQLGTFVGGRRGSPWREAAILSNGIWGPKSRRRRKKVGVFNTLFWKLNQNINHLVLNRGEGAKKFRIFHAIFGKINILPTFVVRTIFRYHHLLPSRRTFLPLPHWPNIYPMIQSFTHGFKNILGDVAHSPGCSCAPEHRDAIVHGRPF